MARSVIVGIPSGLFVPSTEVAAAAEAAIVRPEIY
jgi:hypothetical protein